MGPVCGNTTRTTRWREYRTCSRRQHLFVYVACRPQAQPPFRKYVFMLIIFRGTFACEPMCSLEYGFSFVSANCMCPFQLTVAAPARAASDVPVSAILTTSAHAVTMLYLGCTDLPYSFLHTIYHMEGPALRCAHEPFVDALHTGAAAAFAGRRLEQLRLEPGQHRSRIPVLLERRSRQ